VAVRSEAGRVVEGRVAVANALPAGWSEDFLTAPGYAGAGLQFLCAFPAMPAPPPSTTDFLSAYDAASPDPALAKPKRRGFFGRGGAAPARSGAAVPQKQGRAPSPTVVFSGIPTLTGSEAILFNSARDRGVLPEEVTLARLVVRFPEGSPDPRGLDPGLELRLFVDDPTTPRARVRLADLVRRRGERPLNLRVGRGQAVRIVLADPAGAWARGAPRIEVALGW
jgi:Ca-activated chloride channel family protein